MKKAALYIRVSTDEQLEFSPEAQLKALKEYAIKNNIEIDESFIFKDEGISGKKAEKRPAFMKMIACARKKPCPFDIILVHKFDRFSRNREDSVVYKSLLKRECGVKVISITEQLEDDKFSVILESMLEAMAEYYSLNLADEVKKGMKEKAIRGEYQACPPFGYTKKSNTDTMEINPKEAEYIKFIFNQYLDGMPLLTIAKHLNDMGAYTHRGNKIERRMVEYILQNPVYKGYSRWTPTGKTKRNFNNPMTIIEKGNFPPIISSELFDKVSEKIKNKKYTYKQRPPEEYKHWLSSIVKCSKCGASLIKCGKTAFQCGNYVKGKCKVSHFIKKEILEKAVLEHINNILLYTKSPIIYKINGNKSQNLDEINILNKEIKILNKKLARAKEAYLQEIDTAEEYKNNKIYITSKIKETEDRLNSLNLLNKLSIGNNIELNKLLESNIDNLEKNSFLKIFIEKIVYDKFKRSLYFYYNF